jgi:hypothetical protein
VAAAPQEGGIGVEQLIETINENADRELVEHRPKSGRRIQEIEPRNRRVVVAG